MPGAGSVECGHGCRFIYSTMILRTSKGFHVYYVFDQPMFLRKKRGQFPVLKADQKMSSFVRQWIQKRVAGVDVAAIILEFSEFRVRII